MMITLIAEIFGQVMEAIDRYVAITALAVFIGAPFLYICWQVAGVYAEYRDQGEAVQQYEELNDCLIATITDLSHEKGELEWDNRELQKDRKRLRDENHRIRKEVDSARKAINEPSRN